MNPIFWLVCLTLVCSLPFISFVSYFDIIWPTCLLSYPVCSTLCLSAFVFVFMFTEREDVFVLLCLLLLFSEEVCCCTCRDQTRERSCVFLKMFPSPVIHGIPLRGKCFWINICAHLEKVFREIAKYMQSNITQYNSSVLNTSVILCTT